MRMRIGVRSESERLRAELEERVEELQERLEKSADGQQEPESEVVHRLGELVEDVEGFKLRLKFLEGQMITEKAKSAQYERDLNEKAQMIEGLLGKRRGASVSSGSEEGADELKAAQVKLINEMRDQIFALASALEKERSEHLATKDALEAAAMQIEVNELDEEDPNMATMFSDEEDSPVEAHSPKLETKPAATDCTRDDSVHSTDSEPLPKTPTIDQTRHHRSESFIRHWSFPKGPVTHSSRGSTEDDHCFFFRPNSIDISLPPVEPAKEVLEAPPFLFSYLHHEEPAEMDLQKEALSGYVSASAQVQKRPVPGGLVMMRRKEASGIRSPLSSTSSIQSSVGGRESASGAPKPGSRSLSTRLSLQNLSSWVGSYVGGGGDVSNEEKMSGQELRLSQLNRLRARIAKKSLGRLDFRHAFESEWDEDGNQLMEGDNRIFVI
ncbi:hypothetical protein CROQUDRAFT_176136 [Cronartium quercuum f. sp. fusiforme G11]|uniref:Uncharacterized protein n=1 Tax=Cronartium quercuum f. sp. fusiforme G11 TaxID=708437 RepID=A0A9P6NQW1_9BASI|nr:hypothetical protein CROQUDRAFT_176136 [Cronartium quercuum f. sp. fusiforme G11]